MDDDELLELQREAEWMQHCEYQRGIISLGNFKDGIIYEDCPWCDAKNAYQFDVLCSWNCHKCGYYPGADLFGGKFS